MAVTVGKTLPFTTLDRIAPRSGAALMLEVLRSEGVRYIFGNPGTTEMPLLGAVADAPDISYVLGLQEACVVAMADGYAQASGRPGFVNLHAAGGLGNAMGALIHAQVSNTPLVVTAGQPDQRHGFTDSLLSGNLVGIAGPVVKSAREIVLPDQIPVLLRRAFHDCVATPAGPTFLSLPLDVMESMTAVSAGRVSRIERNAVAGSLDELADALAAIRPGKLALIAGDEIFTSGASAETVALAESFGAPVFGSSWPRQIPFPTAHPLWAGNLAFKASESRAQLEHFDAVFALGGHSAITYTYSEGAPIPSNCRLFQLSAHVGDLGRTYATELSCVGDIKVSLQALLSVLPPKLEQHREAISTLREQASHARVMARAKLEARVATEWDAPKTTPFTAAAQIARAIGPDVAIVDEAAVTMFHVRSFLNSGSSRQYFFMRSAILGWGMPAAVGVSLGLDRQPVVALLGDGASLYSPQALWTAARERLPVTFVVVNNREYNILKNYMRQQSHCPSTRTLRFIGMEITDPAIDFLALAVGLGVAARRVDRAADIAGAVADGIASGRPNLIELPVSAT
jgi:benzoylformate decarboxylase